MEIHMDAAVDGTSIHIVVVAPLGCRVDTSRDGCHDHSTLYRLDWCYRQPMNGPVCMVNYLDVDWTW